ncbi:MAG TPA: tetratricopeptide repeat protein [Thermoanaerobaculia bacterium]|nr:tetratricopeptide repeat protein [Thermoanaerobaculia bacterium]
MDQDGHRGAKARAKLGAAAFLSFLALSLLPAGCGGSPENGSGDRELAAHSATADAEWQWLQNTRRELDEKRQRLAAAGPAADPALARDVERQAAELNRRLLEFINADPPEEGEPLSERQKAALRMKSDEDLLLAREHIEEGGDYQRAIEIYEEALAVDPDNPRLAAELAKARQRRYITAEAFAQVKEGMKEEQVRSLLGRPNLHNVREYPERGVVAWFYPKDESGAAAGVWFEKKADGLVVYEADFEAIRPGQPQPAAVPTT